MRQPQPLRGQGLWNFLKNICNKTGNNTSVLFHPGITIPYNFVFTPQLLCLHGTGIEYTK